MPCDWSLSLSPQLKPRRTNALLYRFIEVMENQSESNIELIRSRNLETGNILAYRRRIDQNLLFDIPKNKTVLSPGNNVVKWLRRIESEHLLQKLTLVDGCT